MTTHQRKTVLWLWLIHDWPIHAIAAHTRLRDTKINRIVRRWKKVGLI